jgi:hypothetical protein
MQPLRSVNQLEADFGDYLRRYAAWHRGDAERLLNKQTGSPASVHEARVIAEAARIYASEGRALLARDDAAQAAGSVQRSTDDQRADVVEVVEELELAASEGKAATHRETVWSEYMDDQTKDELTQRHPLPKAKADALLARIGRDLRKQTPPTPKPQGSGK